MYDSCLWEWDRMVQFSEVIEPNGLSPDLVYRFAGILNKPLALVGSGRGMVLGYLNGLLGREQIMGFDASRQLVSHTYDAGVNNIYWAPPQRPIGGDARFKTILVSTGLLDPLDPNEMAEMLTFFRGRLHRNGTLMLLCPAAEGEHLLIAEKLGAATDLGINQHRFIDLVLEGHKAKSLEKVVQAHITPPELQMSAVTALTHMETLIRFISKKTRCGFTETGHFLKNLLPRVKRLFRMDDLSVGIKQAGLIINHVETVRRMVSPGTDYCLLCRVADHLPHTEAVPAPAFDWRRVVTATNDTLGDIVTGNPHIGT